MTDLLDVTLLVTDALDAHGIRYTVGGSLASSVSGEPRASIDADILVEMNATQVGPFLETLGGPFYADTDAVSRAVATRTAANLIHRPSGIKIDLFVAGSELDTRQLERRRHVQVARNPPRFLYVHSPEDIVLQKLHWYRMGGEVSDRQWRDVCGVIAVQGDRLDRDYLKATAARTGLTALLERAYVAAEAGSA